jgi:hypothetical protein
MLMTNNRITPGDGATTHAGDLQPEALRRPRVRRVALIRTDASGFKLVAAPSKLALRRQ